MGEKRVITDEQVAIVGYLFCDECQHRVWLTLEQESFLRSILGPVQFTCRYCGNLRRLVSLKKGWRNLS